MEGTEGVRGTTPGSAAVGARPLGWREAMAGAFLASLAKPRWWLLSLAAFLLRGGVILVVVPIVTLPTVATLSSLAAPTLSAIVFGNPPAEMVLTYGVAGALLAAWVALAVVVGAWLDLEVVGEAGVDEELALGARRMGTPVRRAATVRLLAHGGTVLAATYAIVRLVVEAYGEIFSPGDAAVPLAWRIALRAPDAIAVLAAAWLVGESLGGLAVRRVAAGDSVRAALGRGVRHLVRPSGVATLVIANLGVALALLPLWLAASRAWDQARIMIVDDAPAPLLVAALLLLVATWCLGLAVLAAGLAWRSTMWTAEAYRSELPTVQPAVTTRIASA